MKKRISLCGLTADELHTLISQQGYTLRHALSITNFLYKKKPGTLKDIRGLPGSLIKYLEENAESGIYKPSDCSISEDKSIKYLFRNSEGLSFETVFIPEGRRNTVCVSTQSGCRMGCPFCLTSGYGFHGNLTVTDIINQVISLPVSEAITHVVFMGMGEPMDNLDNLIKSCEILTAEWGLALSPKNITVSTVGITPGIKAFLERSSCNLAISLYSPYREERIKMIPAEIRYPVNEIIELIRSYPVKKKRRISLAYVMIEDINDAEIHLKGIIDMLAGYNIRVNLLPYHQTGDNLFRSSSEERMHYFKHSLVMSGISASVRKSRGIDISAACGQLASGLK
jgi:23S rRNA (adenine2503-C2)-methyltransferase